MSDPLFLHDCDTCEFMGRYSIGSTTGDGYFCHHRTSPIYQGSVMWRVGDEDWEYHSFPLETVYAMRRDHLAGEPGAEGSVFEDILNDWEKKPCAAAGHKAITA